jgi:hypothetical protein
MRWRFGFYLIGMMSSTSFGYSLREYETTEVTPPPLGSSGAGPDIGKFNVTEITMGPDDYMTYHQFGYLNVFEGVPNLLAPRKSWGYNLQAQPPPAGCFVYGPYVPLPVKADVSGHFNFYFIRAENIIPGTNPKLFEIQVTAHSGTTMVANRAIYASDLPECAEVQGKKIVCDTLSKPMWAKNPTTGIEEPKVVLSLDFMAKDVPPALDM